MSCSAPDSEGDVGDNQVRPRPRPRPSPPEDERSSPKHKRTTSNAVSNAFFYAITVVIVGLWSWGIVLTYTHSGTGGFEMPPSLNAALPIALGGVYSVKALSERNNKRGDDE